MNFKIILIIIAILVIGLIVKLKIQRGDRNLNNSKRPPESLKPSVYVDNDKIIIVKYASLIDLKTVLGQLCNTYNNETYRVLPMLRQYIDSTCVITFPYDIDFETFCYVVNYLYYPVGVKYHPQITAWMTTKTSDSWMREILVNKKVMLYIPAEDKDFDNVYLTTSDNIGFKMGFAIGEESKVLATPNKSYQEPDIKLDQLNDKDGLLFE